MYSNKIANLSEIFSVKPKTNPITAPRNTISKEKPFKNLITEKTTTIKPFTTTITTTSTTKTTTSKETTMVATTKSPNMTSSTSSNVKMTYHVPSTTEPKLELSSPFSVIDLNGYMTDDMNGAQKVNQPIFVETSTKIIESNDVTTKNGKLNKQFCCKFLINKIF